jgi:hypothetical protein
MIEAEIKLNGDSGNHYAYPLLMIADTKYSSHKENSYQVILATGEVQEGTHHYLKGINLSGHGWPLGYGSNEVVKWGFGDFRPFRGTLSLTQN